MSANKTESALIILVAVPVLGLLLGGMYSLPAIKITGERDPWLTLLLVAGLGITVFGIGAFTGTPLSWSASLFLGVSILALIARWMHGSLGHNLERFGLVHMMALLLAFILAAMTHSKQNKPDKAAHPTAISRQIEFELPARRRIVQVVVLNN